MPEIIEIENGIARVINKNIVRQVPLNEVLRRIEKVPEITLPTIARSQVFAHLKTRERGETAMYILCELQPAVRNITKNVRRGYPRGLRRYRLSMPWTYFWFQAFTSDSVTSGNRSQRWAVHSTRVYFARDQYKDIDSSMIVASLPNLDSIGEVCWGSTATNINQSLADQLDQKVNDWYLSDFNDDLDSHVHLPYGERNYLRWVTESRENINSWRNWPEFSETDRRVTVRSLLASVGEEISDAERFTGGGFITPIANLPMTFGRWEEWWQTIPSAERLRALRAGENIRVDEPDTFEEDDDIPEIEEVDDGGVPA